MGSPLPWLTCQLDNDTIFSMDTTEKRYYAYGAGWDAYEDCETLGENITDNDNDGRCIFPGLTGWDTFTEFQEWYDSLSTQEQRDVGTFYLYDSEYDDNRALISDGTYDTVVFAHYA